MLSATTTSTRLKPLLCAAPGLTNDRGTVHCAAFNDRVRAQPHGSAPHPASAPSPQSFAGWRPPVPRSRSTGRVTTRQSKPPAVSPPALTRPAARGRNSPAACGQLDPVGVLFIAAHIAGGHWPPGREPPGPAPDAIATTISSRKNPPRRRPRCSIDNIRSWLTRPTSQSTEISPRCRWPAPCRCRRRWNRHSG